MDGAKVVVSSRKEVNVKKAVDKLRSENLDVTGIVCHVAKSDHRQRLFDEVMVLSRAIG